MFTKKDLHFDDDIKFEKFNFPSFTYEYEDRQREPFTPIGNFPPSPNFNYPGGTFNPPGIPKSPPPNYTPQKNTDGVQKLAASSGGFETKAVSPNSIRFCLYKYTYIWEQNGRSYWVFLLNVDRRTASGFRWFRNNWVYWGLDLRRIDSFICYRSSNSNYACTECNDLSRSSEQQSDVNKEYSLNGTREIYSHTLASIDIPEIKEDIMTKTIACIDDTVIQNDLPCTKTRNISYRLSIEVTYPTSYSYSLKNCINKLADEASEEAYNVISSTRNDDTGNPLEDYNSSIVLVPQILKVFSESFNNKLNSIDVSMNNHEDIAYSIRSEKIRTNWTPSFSNNSL